MELVTACDRETAGHTANRERLPSDLTVDPSQMLHQRTLWPHALPRARFGLMPIASSSDPDAPSRDSRPNARIPALSKDTPLVRPGSKLCGIASCIPRRADSIQQCALSRTTSPPLPVVPTY